MKPVAEVDLTLDDKLSDVFFGWTVDRLTIACETKQLRADMYWICHTIRDAVSLLDINMIKTIIQRLDGGTPVKSELALYANNFGSVLQDIMQLPIEEMCVLRYDDPVYVVFAKAVLHISLQNPGKSTSARRDKNTATEMIFERVGGRMPEPVKEMLETSYTRPEWMNALPVASEDEEEKDIDNDSEV